MTAQQFVFSPKRCVGCQACVLGCWMENRPIQTRPWRRVHTFNRGKHPRLPVFHLSLACHHCEDPACLRSCPVRAYRKDPATGAVIIDTRRCMGCVYAFNGYGAEQGGSVNLLSLGRETDMGHGAAFHDNQVEVEKRP